MKLREVMKDLVSESASGKDMDKLVSFLQRAAAGKVSQQGMLGAGFNLRSPVANNESKLAEALGTNLNINITEDDLREALKELGMKSASDVAKKWNETAGEKQERTKETRREGGEEGF